MIYTVNRPRRRRHGIAFPLFNHIINDVMHAPAANGENGNTRYTTPAVNVKAYEDRFALDLAVPGYRKKDIHITVDNDVLIINSERENTDENTFKVREFAYGKFTRKFRLPEEADAERIEASFSNGILHLDIPKREEVKPRNIAIK